MNNYRQLEEVIVTTSNSKVNRTVNANFIKVNGDPTLTSFYLAIGVTNRLECDLEISRMLIFYHVCPNQLKDLIHHPCTIAPLNQSTNQTTLSSIFVNGSCVENAQPENGHNPVLICSSDGTWSVVSGLGCQCMDGYIEDDDICISELFI